MQCACVMQCDAVCARVRCSACAMQCVRVRYRVRDAVSVGLMGVITNDQSPRSQLEPQQSLPEGLVTWFEFQIQ